MNLEKGTVVKSLKGRDKDKYFCVVCIEDGYVYLCDGKEHKLAKPKRKNIKHLKVTNTVLSEKSYNTNKSLRKALAVYRDTPKFNEEP